MKISVITATRNNASTLSETIRSVMEQSHPDIDHIIIDGASTDDSLEIIRQWATKYPERIRYISETDTGVYNAINKGIKMAHGDIIGTLHGNDRFTSPDILAHIARLFTSPDTNFVYGDIHYIDHHTGKTVRRYSASRFTPASLLNGIAPPHPTLYMRKNIFNLVGLYKENYLIAADFDMFIRLCIIHGIQGTYLPIDMVEMTTGGLSTRLYHRIFTNNREKLRALRENSIKISPFSILKRYLYTLKN